MSLRIGPIWCGFILCLCPAPLPAQNTQTAPATESTPVSRPADALAPAPAHSPAETVEEHWQTIHIENDRIGYSRTRVATRPDGIVETLNETHLALKRFGQTLTIDVKLSTEETVDGDLRSYTYTMSSPTGTTETAGRVDGDSIEITSTIADEKTTRTSPYDPTVKSPAYQDRVLREKRMGPGDRATFLVYLPDVNQPTRVTIAADDWTEITFPNGDKKRLLKTSMTQELFANLPMTAYLDEAGEVRLVEAPMLGMTLRMMDVSREEALQEIADKEFDFALTSLIPATPLENPHQTNRVTYSIHVPDTHAAILFVDDPSQKVRSIDRETVEVTVTAQPLPIHAPAGELDDEFTRHTNMLQSDDPLIRQHLMKAIGSETNPAKIARRLESYVHTTMREVNFTNAFASASEVAKNLEGDCTEHAVFLAALLRAADIPSRVVAGLVYVPGASKMGAHMWTEAYLGKTWIPLDATLAQGGIGAGHIKTGTSSLADDGPLPVACFAPLLSIGVDSKITVLQVERKE